MVSHIRIKFGMNGTISLRLLLDTNVIIDFLKQEDDAFDLSSIVYDAKIVTCDSHFLNCQYDKMQIWKPS